MSEAVSQPVPAVLPNPWWIILLWGIAAIVLGVALLLQPGVTALVWVQTMAIFWLVGGIFDLVGLFTNREKGWVWRALSAVLSILAGLIVLGNPILGTIFTVQILFFFMAISSIVNGVLNVVSGVQMRWGWGPLLLGVLQVLIGLWLLMHPLIGMLALVPVLGVVAIVGGISVSFFAFRVRGAVNALNAEANG